MTATIIHLADARRDRMRRRVIEQQVARIEGAICWWRDLFSPSGRGAPAGPAGAHSIPATRSCVRDDRTDGTRIRWLAADGARPQKREMDGHSGHAGCEVGPDNDGPEAA